MADQVARAAVENFAVHASWVQQQAPGMEVFAGPDLLLSDSGLACDTFNIICWSRMHEGTMVRRLNTAIDIFASNDRPFSWWVSPGDTPANLADLLIEAGLQRAESETAMVADLTSLELDDALPDGWQVRRASSEAELRDFSTVMAANWNPPDPHVVSFYEQAAPFVLRQDSPLQYFVGYVGDMPVTCVELTIGGGVGGIYSVCTLEEYRGRGFGTALTQWALRAAREQGLGMVVLQAGEMGVGIYERLGFRAFGTVSEYKPVSLTSGSLSRD